MKSSNIKERITALPPEMLRLIRAAQGVSRKLQVRAYLVGGFVRDMILKVKNFDLDILVEANGILFAQELAANTAGTLVSHTRFGTATVAAYAGGHKVDIATARKEAYPEPACLPQVEPGTLRDDLARRDFTINAMAASVCEADFGTLIDYFGGLDDLRRGIIRVLHGQSFRDDPTRILRAIRFEKRYGFRIEPLTSRLLKEACRLRMLRQVSPHRLRDEFLLNLKEDEPLRQLRRIRELVGFDFIHPAARFSAASEKLARACLKQVFWFKKRFPQHRPVESWIIFLACIFEELSVQEVKEVCRRFAFRSGDEKRILAYKKGEKALLRHLSQPAVKPSEIFRMLEPLSYETILLLRARTKDKRVLRRTEDFFEIYNGMKLCISGDDLRRLGIAPGPYYRRIFSEVLAAKLNGEVKTLEDELTLIRKMRGSL